MTHTVVTQTKMNTWCVNAMMSVRAMSTCCNGNSRNSGGAKNKLKK